MEQEQRVFRLGPIRPPSEANSLLLQVTSGCTWNKCKFCQLYKDRPFRAFSVESIKEDIDTMAYYGEIARRYLSTGMLFRSYDSFEECKTMTHEELNCVYLVYNWLSHGGENVFLQDGNSLALKPERLEEVLVYLKKTFPQVKRVTSYARAETLYRITEEQYSCLKKAGLDRIHSGYESGSNKVLEFINKGVTKEQQMEAGIRVKNAGIQLSLYFMPGVGGKELSMENAMGTAEVIRQINPDFIRIRTAVITRGSELWEEYLKGQFTLCGDDDKIQELRSIIDNTQECSGELVCGDHILNLLPEVNGILNVDGDRMKDLVDEYLNMDTIQRRIYQYLRRMGRVSCPKDMSLISPKEMSEAKELCTSFHTQEAWDEQVNQWMHRFI